MTTAFQFDNLIELLEASSRQFGDHPLWGTKREGGWEWTSYAEFHATVARFRGGLAQLGVGAGDRVAIISDNRVEWAVACFAAYGLSATFVPMYRTMLPKDWAFILADSEAKVVITAPGVSDEVDRMRGDLPHLQHVIELEGAGDSERSYEGLLRAGDRRPVGATMPSGATVAGLIYTSGTTGKPKGVTLTHANFVSNVNAVAQIFRLEPDDRSLSFLPWAHAYGQTVEMYILMSNGASTAINDDIANLAANLADVKPTVFVGVPRVFNRIYDAVNAQIAEKSAMVQRLFRDGLRAARRLSHGERIGAWRKLELAIDDRLIFSKVRDRFGGRMRLVISAAAALSPEVAEFIDAVGITVYEGYGLSETSPVVACNYPGQRRVGSCGKVIPGVRVEIDESVSPQPGIGEIIVYGPNVMVGYHNRPAENAQAFTPDGGLRTGDLGYFDDDGFLFVTGRIKEQYKLENGKYVMPGPAEETLRTSPYIANVMLYGANRPYNVALVSLNVEAVQAWAAREGIELGDARADERVHRLIAAEIEAHAEDLRGYEVPKRWVLTTDELTTANDMLTPTLKLKRRNVVARYQAELEALYAQAEREQSVPAA